MPRTTLAIDDALLKTLRKRALKEGRTLQDLTNALLRSALVKQKTKPFALQLETWNATLNPGVDITDRNSLFDLMDERK